MGMAASSIALPMWYRVLAVFVGVLSIALAFVVLVDPHLAIWLLIFLLAFALLVVGMDRLVAGISGHPFGWMMRVGVGPAGGSEASATTGTSPGQLPTSKP